MGQLAQELGENGVMDFGWTIPRTESLKVTQISVLIS